MTADPRLAVPADQFALRRTWTDPVPGIEMVQMHFTWTPLGGEPPKAEPHGGVACTTAAVAHR